MYIILFSFILRYPIYISQIQAYLRYQQRQLYKLQIRRLTKSKC